MGKQIPSGIMDPTTQSSSLFLSSRTLSLEMPGPQEGTFTIHASSAFFPS